MMHAMTSARSTKALWLPGHTRGVHLQVQRHDHAVVVDGWMVGAVPLQLVASAAVLFTNDTHDQ